MIIDRCVIPDVDFAQIPYMIITGKYISLYQWGRVMRNTTEENVNNTNISLLIGNAGPYNQAVICVLSIMDPKN